MAADAPAMRRGEDFLGRNIGVAGDPVLRRRSAALPFMAIGKPDERLTIGAIPRDSVVIEMMGQVVFDRARPIAIDLAALSRELKSSTRVSIDVRIGEGRHAATVWGCDLSHRYVDINAEYMT